MKSLFSRSPRIFPSIIIQKRNFRSSIPLFQMSLPEINAKIAEDPTNHKYLLEKARFHCQDDNFTEGLDAYIVAMNAQSMESASPEEYFGEIFYCAERAVKQSPQNTNALMFYGTSLERQSKFSEAVDVYEKAIKILLDQDMKNALTSRVADLKRKIKTTSATSLF